MELLAWCLQVPLAGLGVTHLGSIVYGNGISLAVTGIQAQFCGHSRGGRSPDLSTKAVDLSFIRSELGGRLQDRDNNKHITTSEV